MPCIDSVGEMMASEAKGGPSTRNIVPISVVACRSPHIVRRTGKTDGSSVMKFQARNLPDQIFCRTYAKVSNLRHTVP
jgi:hypothetical protein